MPTEYEAIDPQSFTTFGAMLRYLRRRAHLTQRDLGLAVGYSEGHINRFEKNKHLPDPSAVAALFVPALDLTHEPSLAARLMDLVTPTLTPAAAHPEFALEPIPPAAPHEITRVCTLAHARARLAEEHHLVLCGLPGIGKTTLAGAIARDYAQTLPVFWLTLAEGVTTSAEVWVRRLAGFLLAQGQEQVKPLVAADPGTKIKLSLDQQIALLSSALAKQPALLCFDNAELIRQEEACLQVLRHLSATTPAFLLLTTRESLPLVRVPEMTIEGFENEEGLAFIAQSSDHAFDAQQAARLLEKTDGNPMLLHLALGQLVDPPAEVETLIAHLETQPQVAGYLLQTLQEQSSPQAWRLLLLLAVFQQPLNLYDPYLMELVEPLGGIDNMGEALGELQRRRLIGDAVSARLHPFIHEYVYRTLNAQVSLRERLHRLAGDWLKDANQDAVAAAMHYSRAGLPDQSLDLIEENRDAILARGQVLTAVAILDEVHLQIKRLRTDQPDLLCRLLTVRGILLRNTLRTMEGETNLREAVALASTPAVRASIICELVELTNRRKDYPETLRLVQTMRAELVPDDLLLRSRLVMFEIPAYRASGNLDESDRKATEALALAEQMVGLPLLLSDGVRARAHYELAINAYTRRDLAAAMKYGQAALASARAAHHLGTTNLSLNLIGNLFQELGDLETSVRYRSQAVEGLLAIGDVHSAAYVLTNLADIQHIRGEDDQALEKLERASETLRMLGDMAGLAATEEVRTYCLLWTGQVQEARRAIERLLQEAKGEGANQLWGYRLRKLAMVQLLLGETDAAIATLRRALDLPAVRMRPMMHFELHGTLALALAVAGDPEAGSRELADAPRFEGLSRWSELDRDLMEGYIALARGDVGTACDLANQVLQRAGELPLYRQSANQLIGAIQQSAPGSAFPRLLWVRCQ